MRQEYLDTVVKPGQVVNPLFAFLGMEILEIATDRARFQLAVSPDFIQGAGKLAGGMMALLLDEAMAHAVLGGNSGDAVCTTVDMNVSYYRPVSQGEILVCEARVLKRGNRIVFTEAVISVNERDVAKATASFMVV